MLGSHDIDRESPFRDSMMRGLMFLGSEAKANGATADFSGSDGDLFVHAMATLVFCEIYAQNADARWKTPAEAAMRFIEQSQQQNGGWSAHAKKPADTVTTAWQILALHAADSCGIAVSEAVVQRAAAFLDQMQSDEGAKYGSTAAGNDATATAAGLLAREKLAQLMPTRPLTAAIVRGIDDVVSKPPKRADATANFFAGMLVANLSNGERQLRFRESLLRNNSALSDREPDRYSWFSPDDPMAAAGGRLYQTALSILVLDADRGNLAVCGRKKTVR
jgi:hypothetical protein